MATFSQSTMDKGSDSFTDFCCSSCLEHKIDQWADFYCNNCQKFYCAKCINPHGQLFGKHVTYGRGDTSKWPVIKEVEDFLRKCDLHGEEDLKMFCNDHSQLCCTNCAFLNHRQCAKVTLMSESVKGPPPDLQKVSKKIQTILETLKKLENNWNTNMQSLQVSYNKQLHEIHQTRKKINTMLDEIEKTTVKELDAEMTTLKASLKTDLDNCSKLKNELKHLSDAIHDIVDKSKAELSFIASWKCQEKIRQSESYLSENAVQAERLLTFQADIDIEQFIAKLSGLGRIVLSYADHVFTVQGKSEYNVIIPRDCSSSCAIIAICVLSNDQILLADNFNCCVKLLDQQYQVIGHCDLSAHPNDICQITPSKVAVTMDKDTTNEIQFVSVNGGRLVKGRKLQFQHTCGGIAHDQKDLYLTTGTALYKYSMNGDLLTTLHADTSGNNTVSTCAASPTGDKIFVTNCDHDKVLTLARDGSILCTFTDPDLKGPLGIHVTAQGQVLVCGRDSHTLLQLDGEGRKKLSTLATSSDGLRYPFSVCYNRSTASIIVGQYETDKILVFKVQ
ncbi:uncharacterized protein LOC127832611 [Dreissena polymorpha]|uniref:B box-type domain-containing protein n=1 Tax=Dreissena polymorpha TaxID=45954 RepID=A0A9D4JTU9_DREPO|nr:uncharacterized protein LOC127832611 [Dreissena polymorpha]KAH3824495.1 hypothetical protein DPMN_126332 [Dreissena polymorpha]